MIAGFNTDVEFNGTVYHVQTEDKGAPAHQIMSLVYNKGTILASKRASYDDLLGVNFSEKQVATRVSRQHKLMCAAIRAGRIDELKRLTAKKGGSVHEAPPHQVLAEQALPLSTFVLEPSAPKVAELAMLAAHQLDPFVDEPVIDPIGVIEEAILPPDAVAIVSELAGRERRAHNKLTLEILGDTKFKGGEHRTVNLLISRGTARKVIGGAEVMIKVVGSSFRPVMYHARSDTNGLAKMNLELPHFQSGRAALVVRVLDEGEEIELRRIVSPA